MKMKQKLWDVSIELFETTFFSYTISVLYCISVELHHGTDRERKSKNRAGGRFITARKNYQEFVILLVFVCQFFLHTKGNEIHTTRDKRYS
jgi:hypothetical protein